MTYITVRDYNTDNKTHQTLDIQPYLDETQNIHCMNCCEALDALSFKWSSFDEASGPRQQPETIERILQLTFPPF